MDNVGLWNCVGQIGKKIIWIFTLPPEKRFIEQMRLRQKTPVPPIVWNAQRGTKARGWGEETVDISDYGTQLRCSFIVDTTVVQ